MPLPKAARLLPLSVRRALIRQKNKSRKKELKEKRIRKDITLKNYRYLTKGSARHSTTRASATYPGTQGGRFLETIGETLVKGKTGNEIFTAKTAYDAFESVFAIGLFSNRHPLRQTAVLGLGFEKDKLIIEVMQAPFKFRSTNNRFRRATQGTKPLNFLLRIAEQKARASGFNEIKIRAPETLHYYGQPARVEGENYRTIDYNKRDAEIRRRMRIMYARIAKAEGYKRENLFFYTKKL